jgi:hypothetical protein
MVIMITEKYDYQHLALLSVSGRQTAGKPVQTKYFVL